MPDRPLLLAVLIDADNVSAASAEAILKEIATLGEPGLRRVYGDWSSAALGQWKKKALELGLVMHQQSANTKGKNASDIGLVIDAMDILHGGRFDGFVLVSSDSDFTRLASRIREDGRQVIGIGEGKTPEALRNVCNRFILIENIMSETEAPEARGETPPPARTREPPSAVIPLVIKAMKTIDPEGEWFGLGVVGQTIQQANPDFDPRTYGAAKLSDLLRKVGRFEVRQGGTGNRLEVRDRA
jgi:hypothetical protein